MDHQQAKQRGIRFVRKVLDTALQDAPDDVWRDPAETAGEPRTLSLSLRLARAIGDAGYAMSASSGSKRIDGVKQRMELEDLFDMAILAAGHSSLRAVHENDQARDRLAEKIWDCLHHKHVVLRRIRRHG